MKQFALFPALLLIGVSASLGAIAVRATEATALKPSLQTSAHQVEVPNGSPTTVTLPQPNSTGEVLAPAAVTRSDEAASTLLAVTEDEAPTVATPIVARADEVPVAQLPAAIARAPSYPNDVEKAAELFFKLNEARANAALDPLESDRELEEIAIDRARDLIENGYFDHYSPAGGNAFSELGARGIRYRLAGENLARNNYPEIRTVAAAFDGLMGSPGHRANILEPRFTRTGVAVVKSGKVWYYVTVFAD